MFNKKNILLLCGFLFLFCGFLFHSFAQDSTFYDSADEEPVAGTPWERKGFEFSIGGNVYFASKKTANYYNGAPENNINFNLLWKNEYRRREIETLLREKYRYVGADGSIDFSNDYNYDATYNLAMDIALGIKYRFHKNWYLELSYSFRRLTVQNYFFFKFPDVLDGNKENPPYSDNESFVAKEDRHYIDLSVGYIFQKHTIVKPFLSLGAQFTYIRIKEFNVVIENQPYDLMHMARNPNYQPGVQDETYYMDWSGPGYGFLFTAGIKIAFSKMVSLDPIFQMSVASFGNSSSKLPNFNTAFCFNYIAGVRLVVSDGFFSRNK